MTNNNTNRSIRILFLQAYRRLSTKLLSQCFATIQLQSLFILNAMNQNVDDISIGPKVLKMEYSLIILNYLRSCND